MDWINENRLKNGLIAALVVLNLITLSIIWVRTAANGAPPAGEQERRPSESAGLMKSALGLSDKQAETFSGMVADFHAQTKAVNDRLSTLKKHLADELFTNTPDTTAARETAREIGEAQAEVEMQRFRHFQEFLAVCTPDQREMLRPILTDLFGRRPPREGPRLSQGPERDRQDGPGRASGRREGPPDATGRQEVRDSSGRARAAAQPIEPGRGAPPSVDEKLARYSERLGLSAGQEQQIRRILQETRQKGEELRNRTNPGRNVIEAEKDKIRKDEDRRIRAILNPQQQLTFDAMIANRGDSQR